MHASGKIKKEWKTLIRILDCAEYNQIPSLLATKAQKNRIKGGSDFVHCPDSKELEDKKKF
jgi:hypothetical protein